MLRELTAVESITDSAGLEEYLRGLHRKEEVSSNSTVRHATQLLMNDETDIQG